VEQVFTRSSLDQLVFTVLVFTVPCSIMSKTTVGWFKVNWITWNMDSWLAMVRDYYFTKAGDVMWSVILSVCLSVCLCVCHSVSRITHERTSTKHGRLGQEVTLWKWLTFGGDPDPHVHSESLIHFIHHCGIWDFRRFTSISHTITGRFLRYLAK